MQTATRCEQKLGTAALWLALAGIVTPHVAFFAIAFTYPEYYYDGQDWDYLHARCVVLAYILEAAALVCGIQASRTSAGKWGLLVGNVALMLYLRAWG